MNNCKEIAKQPRKRGAEAMTKPLNTRKVTRLLLDGKPRTEAELADELGISLEAVKGAVHQLRIGRHLVKTFTLSEQGIEHAKRKPLDERSAEGKARRLQARKDTADRKAREASASIVEQAMSGQPALQALWGVALMEEA